MPLDILQLAKKLFVLIDNYFIGILLYNNNLAIIEDVLKMVSIMLILFFFRIIIVYFSKKIAKKSIEIYHENTFLTVSLIIIGIYLFFLGYFILNYFLAGKINNIKLFILDFLWITLFPIIGITLHFCSEKTALLLKTVLISRQSYFFLTALFALTLAVLDLVPNIESIKENLICLIEHKNNKPFEEIFIDFNFFVEDQYILAFQLVWFFLYLNLLGILLDPNVSLIYKILFTFLGSFFPGLGFFSNSLELNIKETKILVQKNILKGELKFNKSKVFSKFEQKQLSNNESSLLSKQIIEKADKHNIKPIKSHSELAMTVFTHVSRCISKTKVEFFKNLEKVTNMLGTSDGIINKEGLHKDFSELKPIIDVNKGIAKYKSAYLYSSYENCKNSYQSVVAFKKDIENDLNIKFDNAKNAVAIRQNNLNYLCPIFTGMNENQKNILLRVGTVLHIDKISALTNNNLEKIITSFHDVDNLPTLRVQVFSKLFPQYIVIGEIEREGQYTISSKNYEKGQGEIFIQEKDTNKIFLLEVKFLVSERYKDKFEEYSEKLIKQIVKKCANNNERLNNPVLLCICTLPKTNNINVEDKTKELQEIIDNILANLGEISDLCNIKGNIKGKVMIIENIENEKSQIKY